MISDLVFKIKSFEGAGLILFTTPQADLEKIMSAPPDRNAINYILQI